MAIKSKISTSLRNSISAEKKSVETKNFTVSENTNQQETLKNTNLTKKVEKKEQDLVKEKPVVVAGTNKPKNTIDNSKTDFNLFSNKFPMLEFNYTKLPLFNNSNSIKEAAEKIVEITHNVTNICLENLVAMNDNINRYFKEVVKANNPANLYEINLKFFSNLKESQQQLISESIKAFELSPKK